MCVHSWLRLTIPFSCARSCVLSAPADVVDIGIVFGDPASVSSHDQLCCASGCYCDVAVHIIRLSWLRWRLLLSCVFAFVRLAWLRWRLLLSCVFVLITLALFVQRLVVFGAQAGGHRLAAPAARSARLGVQGNVNADASPWRSWRCCSRVVSATSGADGAVAFCSRRALVGCR